MSFCCCCWGGECGIGRDEDDGSMLEVVVVVWEWEWELCLLGRDERDER